MNYNKVIKDLKERNDKLQEQYRLRDIRCIHLEYENEMLKSDFKAQHELTKKYAEESKELNKKYLNAVADYETTMSDKTELEKQIAILDKTNIQLISKLDRYDVIVDERDELKKQLTTYQILHRDCKVDNLKNISKIEEKENQQKEFIKYLEEEISKWHYNYDSYTYEYEIEEPTAEELLEDALSKFKEIIGGKDE